MWIVCITSVRHVLTVNGYGGRQTKENEKSWCFKGWETLDNNIISYKYVSKKDISSAFNTITFVKYKGFNFFVENSSEGKFILRPLEEAMKYFKDFPRHGYDPIYEAMEEEISDIWEERRPIEGFKFDVEPIVYLKKDGIWLVEE